MKKRKFIYVLLAGLVFAACSNEDQAVQQPQKQSRPLTIEVTENPLIQDGAEGSNSNRAAITTGSTLTSFKLDYVYTKGATLYTNGVGHAYSATNTSGTWSTSGIWPESGGDNTVYWYAYTDGTFQPNEGTPYVNFTVEESVPSQKDLLVATVSGTENGTGGNLSFTFDHACAALRFYVKKAKTHTATLNISSVRLCNVYKQGKYYFGDGTWSVSTTIDNPISNYTLSSAISDLGSDAYQLLNGSADNSYLFLIPQTLTGWNGTSGTYVEIAWSYSGGTPSSGTAKVPLAKTLEKGKKYDVKINIGSTVLGLN